MVNSSPTCMERRPGQDFRSRLVLGDNQPLTWLGWACRIISTNVLISGHSLGCSRGITMARAAYQEVVTSRALNRVRGMEFQWSFNPYQGCAHGCHYCFARRYHYLREQNPHDDFSNNIQVKVNVPEVLRRELCSPSWKFDVGAVGTPTDPYQPVEGKYQLTRRCIQVFCDKQSPISLVTKGTMIVRDVDVLSDLARLAGCTVCFSITTLDESLRRQLEPGTPPALKRLQAMEKLALAGGNAGVILAPIIPGITDGEANLREVAQGALDHGARFLGSNVLFLREGTKEHFLAFLEREYPDLTGSYRTLYAGAFVSPYTKQKVQAQVPRIKTTLGLVDRQAQVHGAGRPRQLQLSL